MSDLENEVKQLKAQCKGLASQLQATTQMFNNSLQSETQLRANLILLQGSNQELTAQNKALADSSNNLIKEIADLKAKLEPAPAASWDT